MAAYLDWNASAPLHPAAREAMAAAMAVCGNPSSVHAYGRAIRAGIEAARRAVAALAGAHPAQVLFTASGTEANNLALSRLGGASRLVSAIEHDSVRRPAAQFADHAEIPVLASGVIDLDAAAASLARLPRPCLVSVQAANNETGVIQPIATLARLVRNAGGRLHVDAIQAAGRLEIALEGLGADAMSLSAHKLGGPAGVGALVLRSGVELAALTLGGGQESGRRAGTENHLGIVGFGAVAALAPELRAAQEQIATLRDRLETGIRRLDQAAPIHGAESPRLANTSLIGMPGMPAETQVVAFDLDGVAVSAGAACSSGKVRPSHVLTAMGRDAHTAAEAVRVSLGPTSTEAEVDAFLAAWVKLWRRRR